MSLEQTKHVATCLADGGHFGNDGQVVDDEAHFILLDLGQVVGMPQQTKASHICGAMCIVFVHQACR